MTTAERRGYLRGLQDACTIAERHAREAGQARYTIPERFLDESLLRGARDEAASIALALALMIQRKKDEVKQ